MTISAVTDNARVEKRDPFTEEISVAESSSQRAGSVWQGGLKSQVTVRDHTFEVDAPTAAGGTDAAASPMEVILGAVESCITIVINARAGELGIPLEEIHTYGYIQADDRGLGNVAYVQPYYHYFRLQLVVQTSVRDGAKLQALTEAVERSCPALNLIKDANVQVEVSWAFVEETAHADAEYLANQALGYDQHDPEATAPKVFFEVDSVKYRQPVG